MATLDASKPWDTLDPDMQRKKIGRAKQRLNDDAIRRMTPQLFSETDPQGEILTWLRKIAVLCGK